MSIFLKQRRKEKKEGKLKEAAIKNLINDFRNALEQGHDKALDERNFLAFKNGNNKIKYINIIK